MSADIDHQLIHTDRSDDGEFLPRDDGKGPPCQEPEIAVRIAQGKRCNLRATGGNEPPSVADAFSLFYPLNEGDLRFQGQDRFKFNAFCCLMRRKVSVHHDPGPYHRKICFGKVKDGSAPCTVDMLGFNTGSMQNLQSSVKLGQLPSREALIVPIRSREVGVHAFDLDPPHGSQTTHEM